jgi:diadenosine tetraphosphate (Ap4A) HIT family hydrolase
MLNDTRRAPDNCIHILRTAAHREELLMTAPDALTESFPANDCELCRRPGGIVVASAARWRLVRVPDPDFPAFYRVVWGAHCREMTDLVPADRKDLLEVVWTVEGVLRQALQPEKINLASLGNVVPHLHWHVIARFGWDSHFPQPVWGTRQRKVDPAPSDRLGMSLEELDRQMARAVGACRVAE